MIEVPYSSPGATTFRLVAAHLLAAAAYLLIAARTTGIELVPILVALTIVVSGFLVGERRRWAEVAMPFVAFAACYHWLGWLRPAVALNGGVHVFYPYWLDKTLFGVGGLNHRLSCNEIFAARHTPVVDFITGLAYLSFLPCVFAFALYLTFFDGRLARMRRARRFGWTFLGMNVAGFGTYLICPVAPPWYVAMKGFGPVDPATRSSPAALARWDAMTGIPYFQQFYARATEVFGALPSLHCAYPMLLVLFAWEMGRKRLTAALAGYQLLMCFSAVYLQHHYVTDVIAGTLYASVAYAVGRFWPFARGSRPDAVATLQR